MALFKISKGLKANLPSTKIEGHCYYTTDDSLFYIDYKDDNGTLQRKCLNAANATNDIKSRPFERTYSSLMLRGTKVPSGANLNSIEYLAAGTYYSYTDADIQAMSNCPTQTKFIMEVYTWAEVLDNETTATWQFRVRRLIDRLGNEWIQYANSNGTAGNFTYGSWMKTLSSSIVSATELDKLTGIESNVQEQLDYIKRTSATLVLDGTKIPSGADLNSIDYLRVGHYYNFTSSEVQAMINKPSNLTLPFTMEVYSPAKSKIDDESTATWIYRVRKIIDTQGKEWIQYASSNGTAGNFTYSTWREYIQANPGRINDRAAYIDGGGRLNSSSVTITELNYLDGATSNIQAQLNAKAPAYTYGTSELTAGTSTLATGTIYIQYE